MSVSNDSIRAELLRGVLLGTAVGDALGLRAEGLPRRVTRQMTWGRGPFFGFAVFSDDTEQSFLVAQALLSSGSVPERFRRALRWRLIAWFFALPPGVGFGTARSILKLAVGFRSGIVTAGNGAAMRTAIIGAAHWDDPEMVKQLVRESTELTHGDPRALVGALAIALAAGAAARGEGLDEVLAAVADLADAAPDSKGWRNAVTALATSLQRGDDVATFAASVSCERGVSGYVYHTVPVALFAWARFNDPEEALRQTWACGGDTDTVGAIVGALAYAKARGLPPETWMARLKDFPLTATQLAAAADALAKRGRPVRWWWFLMPLRNLVVFPAILLYALLVMMPRKWLTR